MIEQQNPFMTDEEIEDKLKETICEIGRLLSLGAWLRQTMATFHAELRMAMFLLLQPVSAKVQ